MAHYVKLKSWSNLTKFGVQSFPAYGQMKLNSWLEGWEGFADLKKVKQKRWQHFCSNLCKVKKFGVQSVPAYGQMKPNRCLEGWKGVADLKKVKQKRRQHFCSNLRKVEK